VSLKNLLILGAGLSLLCQGCSGDEVPQAELAKVRGQLDEATKAKMAVEAEMAKLHARLAEVEAENTKLKQTPRYYFDQAVARMKASKDDAGDNEAVTAFQNVVDRFPDDPLGTAAENKIGDLKTRIGERGRKRRQAQARVRKLIKICRRNFRKSNEVSQGGMRFTHGGAGGLDMNRLMAADRKAQPYRKKVEAAVREAEKLLAGGVPDPGGKLAAELRRCDEFE